MIDGVWNNQHNFLNVLKTDINMDFFGSLTIFFTSILKKQPTEHLITCLKTCSILLLIMQFMLTCSRKQHSNVTERQLILSIWSLVYKKNPIIPLSQLNSVYNRYIFCALIKKHQKPVFCMLGKRSKRIWDFFPSGTQP